MHCVMMVIHCNKLNEVGRYMCTAICVLNPWRKSGIVLGQRRSRLLLCAPDLCMFQEQPILVMLLYHFTLL